MNVTFEIRHLKNEADWKQLGAFLSGASQLGAFLGGASDVVSCVIRHLMLSNVVSYLVENPYIDCDYSSDYRFFYAQTFRTYDRHCKRVHFFAEDVGAIFALPNWNERVKALQATSLRSYFGFCVIRPLPNASIGRSVLKMRGPEGKDLESVITCRADVRANLLGAELDVCGAAFMQQDSRVGACAQIAIWMGARHMHQRYRQLAFCSGHHKACRTDNVRRVHVIARGIGFLDVRAHDPRRQRNGLPAALLQGQT